MNGYSALSRKYKHAILLQLFLTIDDQCARETVIICIGKWFESSCFELFTVGKLKADCTSLRINQYLIAI